MAENKVPTGEAAPKGFNLEDFELVQPGDDSTFVQQFVTNIPGDAWEVVKQTVYPVAHPVDFVHGISSLIGEPAVRRQVWDGLKERYGSFEGIKNYAAENPVQFGMDVSSTLSGLGLLSRVGALGQLGKTAATAGKIGKFSNPLGLPSAGLAGVRNLISQTKLPESIYQAALKIPVGALKQTERRKVVNTLLRDEKVALRAGNAESNIEKMTKTISEIDTDITKFLDNLSAGGSDFEIDVVAKKLDDLKYSYRNRSNPKAYQDAIEEVKQEFVSHSFVNQGRINLADANQLKKGTYQEIGEFYKKAQHPELGRTGLFGENPVPRAKAIAVSAIKEAILSNPGITPQVKKMMRREAGLMNARKWVERATLKGGTMDMLSLKGMVFGILVDGGVKGGAAWRIAATPYMESKLALLLQHGSETLRRTGAVVRPGTLGTFQAGRLIKEDVRQE